VPRSRKCGSIQPFPVRLHGVVHNYLSTGTTWPYLHQSYQSTCSFPSFPTKSCVCFQSSSLVSRPVAKQNWAAHSGSVVSWLCSVCHSHYLHCPCEQSPLDSVGLLYIRKRLETSPEVEVKHRNAGGCGVMYVWNRGRLIAHQRTCGGAVGRLHFVTRIVCLKKRKILPRRRMMLRGYRNVCRFYMILF
jgi:hypothetical protein